MGLAAPGLGMEVRGERQCRDCDTRWSYYETGSVTCPTCGSPRSVGVDEPTRHTDGPATLDLDEARSAAAADRTEEATRLAARAAREYCATRGFVAAGDLEPLDGTYVAARELEATAGLLGTRRRPDDAATAYFLALLRGAPDGDRPDDVPESMWGARGLGVARAVGDYRGEVATWIRDDEGRADGAARDLLERLADHATRVEALDGDVDPETAATLLAAARALGTALREDDGDARDAARAALEALEPAG